MKYNVLPTVIFSLLVVSCSDNSVAQNHPCSSGAVPLANAYVRSNPIYSMFYGDLSTYLPSNSGHFQTNGDAIQCARIMANALLQRSVSSYDPQALQRSHEMRVKLETIGISAGPRAATASEMLLQLGMQLQRLARVLPAAALGDYGPYYTPTNEIEEMQLFAAQLLPTLLQDPTVRQSFMQVEPLIREAAEAEYQWIVNMALGMARN